MATLEEVAAKLAQMEAKLRQQDESNQLNEFIGMYGSEFSNDPEIGQSILGHLNAQGIGLQEAADAVKQIMDKLRAEYAELGRKINKVETAVADAQAESAMIQPEQAPPPPIEAPPSPDMGGMPPMDAGAPPPDMGPPPADAGAPPTDMPPMPDEGAPPPPDMLSDARYKNWRPTILSDERLKSLAEDQLGGLSDDDVAIIDALCGLPGISDEDIIGVLMADEDDSVGAFDAVLDKAGDVPEEEALAADETIENAANQISTNSHEFSPQVKESDLALDNLLSDENLKNIGGEKESELDEGKVIMNALLRK